MGGKGVGGNVRGRERGEGRERKGKGKTIPPQFLSHFKPCSVQSLN